MTHPEEAAAVRWMQGRTVEIGVGSNPTPGVDTTVDHTPAGELGGAGCELGRTSVATITADMAALPFADGEYDTLVARHVLEHHPDTITILKEWARVAKRLVIICPDQHSYPGSTIQLDPTHRAAFTPFQLSALIWHVGLRIVVTGAVVPQWSFLLVAERTRVKWIFPRTGQEIEPPPPLLAALYETHPPQPNSPPVPQRPPLATPPPPGTR